MTSESKLSEIEDKRRAMNSGRKTSVPDVLHSLLEFACLQMTNTNPFLLKKYIAKIKLLVLVCPFLLRIFRDSKLARLENLPLFEKLEKGERRRKKRL